MSTTLSFKDIVDKPEYRPLAPAALASAVGHAVCSDLRNSLDVDPHVWLFNALTSLNKYSKPNDEWLASVAFTTLTGTVVAGAYAIFVPSHGPAGAVAGSPTATSFTLAALPNGATIGINQLANRGDGRGFKIRVYANTAAASGLCEERLIVANTPGATPVVTLASALSFTPAVGARYEVLSGRVYLLTAAASTIAGMWKAYDVATGSISGNLSIVNLAAAIATDSTGIALDELYVSYNRNPGEGVLDGGAVTYNGGLLKAIQATAAAATTITGSGMPAGLAANEYANFQIRVVEDVTAPLACGQRRRITSHTAGATGVFTVPTWTTTPSTEAKFVVENNNDLLLWTNAATVTYSYAAGGYAADASWSTAVAAGGAMQYANPPAAMGAGCMAAASFSIAVDNARNARHSHVIWFRGAATNAVYYLDIANGANGTWSALLQYGGIGPTFTTGASGEHDPVASAGQYFYISVNGTQRFARFDLLNRVLEPWAYLRYLQGAAVVGARLATYPFIDGATKVTFLFVLGQVTTNCYECLLQR